jgi:hypothetical protein
MEPAHRHDEDSIDPRLEKLASWRPAGGAPDAN